MFRVEVKNLGPIIEGGVDVKPLTIFIGPNNSGKSYMATSIYALLRSLGRLLSPQPYVDVSREVRKAWQPARQPLARWLAAEGLPPDGGFEFSLLSLPEEVKALVSEVVAVWTTASAELLTSEVQRCYGSQLSDIVRGGSARGLSLRLKQGEDQLSLSFSSSNDKLKAHRPQFKFSDVTVEVPPFSGLRYFGQGAEATSSHETIDFVFGRALDAVWRKLFRELLVWSYYLPAARSGILQNYRALVSFTMTRIPLVGIEKPLDIPQFTGVIADFIGFLLRIERRQKTVLSAMADLLEKEVSRGRILLEEEKHLYPEIFFEDEREGRFPLHRTSSGVSELAPLILFVRYIVDPGDFLIIEEPEAHLHPGAQRKLAQVLVRLVRAGVKLLITTHSDYLVQQLSNFVSLGQLPPRIRAKQGYSKDDYLLPEEMGAYAFKLDEDRGGSTIQELKVDKEGIDEEEFSKVAEELYGEMVYLHRKLAAK